MVQAVGGSNPLAHLQGTGCKSAGFEIAAGRHAGSLGSIWGPISLETLRHAGVRVTESRPAPHLKLSAQARDLAAKTSSVSNCHARAFRLATGRAKNASPGSPLRADSVGSGAMSLALRRWPALRRSGQPLSQAVQRDLERLRQDHQRSEPRLALTLLSVVDVHAIVSWPPARTLPETGTWLRAVRAASLRTSSATRLARPGARVRNR
jgi:hypothetical protein